MYTVDSLNENFAKLTDDERQQLFGLIAQNTALFAKLFPSMPLIDHIAGTVPSNLNHPVIQAFELWKNTQATLP
jgi:hypothetical protein